MLNKKQRLKIEDGYLWFNLIIGCDKNDPYDAGFYDVTEIKLKKKHIYLYCKHKEIGCVGFDSKIKDLNKKEKLILLEYLKLQVENEE